MNPTGKVTLATPQFRAALARQLKRCFPTCHAQITELPGGEVSFHLYDEDGARRSGDVVLSRHTANTLTRAGLCRHIRAAGEVDNGFPPGMRI